jgi:hypothetical protein
LFQTYPLVTSQDEANYLQGPSAMAMPDGSIAVVMDWGYCCLSPDDPRGGERIGILRFPVSGAPKYVEHLNTQNMRNVDGLGNDAHEAAYPTVLRVGNDWWVAYSSTLWPIEGEKIGVGLAKFNDLAEPPTLVRHRSWLLSERHAWSPTLVWIGGRLYLYTNDVTKPISNQVIRQQVYSEEELGAEELVVLPGLGQFVYGLTDIAVRSDGVIVGLTGQDYRGESIGLWESDDGLHFEKVGSFSRPGYSVFDGGFLRHPDGRLVEPMVVFGNATSPGMDAPTGSWKLAWWAEPGAALPKSLCFMPRIRPRILRQSSE